MAEGGSGVFAGFITPVREGMALAPTDEESRLVAAHFAYLTGQAQAGRVLMAGRTLEPPHVGLVLVRAASVGDAEALLRADPGVRGGVFALRVQGFRVAIGPAW